ncbi:hypothetical protein QYE76_006434 [Lolium multiflorum]|uniref:Uncharacterized protein n=1 Tax=Lolium multiflorum TaxID=4521 RepID=A0AAD8W3A6_LOLMU|nr:hypothetical protein QYE76_006434 [Lolium multiflorum]
MEGRRCGVGLVWEAGRGCEEEEKSRGGNPREKLPVVRWHIETPSIIEGSVLIISRTGLGLRMFSMGQFMALQERIIACGPNLTMLSMVLRFIAGPAATAAAAAALGLRGDVLRATIIQAALPQSIAAFGFARVYGLHADVLGTAGVLPSTRRPLGCATVAVGAELFAHLASYWHQAHLDLNFNSVSTGDPGATNSTDPSLTISIGSVYPPFLGCSFSDDGRCNRRAAMQTSLVKDVLPQGFQWKITLHAISNLGT